MIVGYHIIFGAYGFWLPNDPRGSWSDFVGSWELFRYGRATKTNERRSLAREEHDFRRSASRLITKTTEFKLWCTGRGASAIAFPRRAWERGEIN